MDLRGKTVIVTGANTGIGRVTATTLAGQGARVLLACRSAAKTAPVVAEIASRGGVAEFLPLDLADLSSVRAAAESFVKRSLPLTVLVNNAGLAGASGRTKDGFEITFGTNYVGPYLFTRLLLPALERARGSRVVNVASVAHLKARSIEWDSLRTAAPPWLWLHQYSVSKLANVLFSNELSRRAADAGVHSYALHPGVIASDVWRAVPFGLRHVIKLFFASVEEGARTSLYCATSDEVKDQTGRYYDGCKERNPSRVARDVALARELWVKTASWVGLPE